MTAPNTGQTAQSEANSAAHKRGPRALHWHLARRVGERAGRAREAGLLSFGFGEASHHPPWGLGTAAAWPSTPARHPLPPRGRRASPGAVGAHVHPQAGLSASKGSQTLLRLLDPVNPKICSVGNPGLLCSPGCLWSSYLSPPTPPLTPLISTSRAARSLSFALFAKHSATFGETLVSFSTQS